MKSIILGIFAVMATANAGVLQFLQAPTLVRTPSLDSAIIHSERANGAFSYSTHENHAYAPVIQSYPVLRQVIYPQHPHFFYPGINPVLSIYPGIYPTYAGVPLQIPGYAPPVGGPGVHPGVNPQNPIEVEDPADNRPNEDLQQGQGNDEDTVAIDSA